MFVARCFIWVYRLLNFNSMLFCRVFVIYCGFTLFGGFDLFCLSLLFSVCLRMSGIVSYNNIGYAFG